MKRVSVSDIRRSYPSEKARSDLINHLWIYLVLRPLSFYVTPVFINLGLSANAVTGLGLFPLVGGLVFISTIGGDIPPSERTAGRLGEWTDPRFDLKVERQ